MHFPPLRILDSCFGTGFLFYFLGDLSRGLLYVTLVWLYDSVALRIIPMTIPFLIVSERLKVTVAQNTSPSLGDH